VRNERGAATIEMIIAAPFVLLILAAGLQIGIASHVNHVLLTASRSTAQREAVGEPGAEWANQFIESTAANQWATDITITVTHGPDTVRVTITAKSLQFVPGLSTDIQVVSENPIEQFKSAR